MIITGLYIHPAGQVLAVQAQNSLGTPVSATFEGAQVGEDGLAAIRTLLERAQALLPDDPPADLMQEIGELEARLVTLRKAAGFPSQDILV